MTPSRFPALATPRAPTTGAPIWPRSTLLVLALIALIAGGCINNPGATPSASQNASPEPSGAAAITLTCDDFPSSGTISPVATLATGVVLTITMCDVGSDGGYQWADPVYDPRALALVGEDSIAPPGQPGLVGASGSSVWRFQALAVESSTITFADRRVWEKGVPPFLSVVVSVKATPSSSFTPLPVITPAATAIPAPLLTPSPASTPAVSEGQPPAEPAGFTAYQHAVTVQCPSPNANSHLRWQTDLAWHSSVDAATWFRVNEGWTGEGPGDITCPTTPIIPILPANSWYWGRPQGPEAPPWSPPSTSVAAHPAVG